MVSNWEDLNARGISAIVMVIVGAFDVYMGGIWFHFLVMFATGVMIWELWSMIAPSRTTGAMLMAVATVAILSVQIEEQNEILPFLFLIIPAIGAVLLKKLRVAFFFYALAIIIAGFALVVFRDQFGALWILWLLLVVIASDVLGYFAGRTFGGPKFWPAISPKKTWSGTVAGWIGAGVVGLVFAMFTEASMILVPLSMLLSFAGQLGDIAESAIKRRTGVKDSSNLIPGHGGLLDRFDALLFVALVMFALTMLFSLNGITF